MPTKLQLPLAICLTQWKDTDPEIGELEKILSVHYDLCINMREYSTPHNYFKYPWLVLTANGYRMDDKVETSATDTDNQIYTVNSFIKLHAGEPTTNAPMDTSKHSYIIEFVSGHLSDSIGINQLQAQVNQRIQEGYKPIGSLITAPMFDADVPGMIHLMQAMGLDM